MEAVKRWRAVDVAVEVLRSHSVADELMSREESLRDLSYTHRQAAKLLE